MKVKALQESDGNCCRVILKPSKARIPALRNAFVLYKPESELQTMAPNQSNSLQCC